MNGRHKKHPGIHKGNHGKSGMTTDKTKPKISHHTRRMLLLKHASEPAYLLQKLCSKNDQNRKPGKPKALDVITRMVEQKGNAK